MSDVDATNKPGAVQDPQVGRRRIPQMCGSVTGGVRAHLVDCTRLLTANSHDVIVETPAAVLDGLDIEPARAEPLEIGPRPSLNDTLAVVRLRRLGRRADVLHAHGLRAGVLTALALGRRCRGRTRLVVTFHSLTVGGCLTILVGDRLERLIARRADLVLAVSPDLTERAQDLGALHVEVVITPAVPLQWPAEPSPSDTATAEDAQSRDGARPLTVACLARQKGLSLLLEAVVILSHEVDAGRLTAFTWALAGGDPGHEQAAEHITAEQLPVTLLGRRNDASALMEVADIVVQTSPWKGQPLTIQEALRVGTAIMITDVGGTAVTARGGALLVGPQAQTVAEALRTLLSDPKARTRAVERTQVATRRLPGLEDPATQLRQTVLDLH